MRIPLDLDAKSLNNKTLFRIIRCLEADASKPPAERTFPVFVVVATKFRQLAGTRPVLELCLSSEGTIAYNPLQLSFVSKSDPQKYKKHLEISCAGCPMRAEGFFCTGSLNVLYGGLRIGVLQLLIKKIFFFSVQVLHFFWSSKPWIRIRVGIQLKC